MFDAARRLQLPSGSRRDKRHPQCSGDPHEPQAVQTPTDLLRPQHRQSHINRVTKSTAVQPTLLHHRHLHQTYRWCDKVGKAATLLRRTKPNPSARQAKARVTQPVASAGSQRCVAPPANDVWITREGLPVPPTRSLYAWQLSDVPIVQVSLYQPIPALRLDPPASVSTHWKCKGKRHGKESSSNDGASVQSYQCSPSSSLQPNGNKTR